MYDVGMTPKGTRAAIYVRLSRDRVGETSTARQEKDCRALASAKGLDVVEVFSDVDLSAFKPGVVRPAYERMIAAAEAGELDVVVVWKVDRLARSLREFVRVTELLDEHGVSLLSVNESFDTSSPMGRAMMQIVSVFAELESGTISLRTKSAKAHSAALGKPNGGGRRPYGYTDQTFAELVPEEADVLRTTARRALAGESLHGIAAGLNRRGVRTSEGNDWTSQKLGRVLRSPHLAAIRVHRAQDGKRTVELGRTAGDWPAILTVDEHEQLVAAIGEHRPATVRRHLLTGFARCGACGANLRRKSTKRAGEQYVCNEPGCYRIGVKAPDLEQLIGEAVQHRAGTDEVRDALAASSGSDALRATAAALAIDREALEQLSRDHYVDRRVSRDVFLASAGDLEDRVAAAEAKIARLQASTHSLPGGGDLGALWWSADLELRRSILGVLVERITIEPVGKAAGGRFDPERVDVVWRI